MGQRDFETKLYYQLSLDRLVPQDHVLRRIAAAVGFSFVRPLCRPFYSYTGQPSVDPVVIFKLLLLGYLYGITSERRLAQEVRLHLGYRWLVRRCRRRTCRSRRRCSAPCRRVFHRPQTNGKAEAFNKTLQREWAYVRLYRSNAERLAALPLFLQEYNGDRPHTALGGLPPLTRICQ